VTDPAIAAWPSWNLASWNDALVNGVFIKRPDLPAQVIRIDATSRLLVAAANGKSLEADEIHKSFIGCFPRSRSAFGRLFDVSSQTRHWRPSDVELPFFAQLYLTVLVASADEETFEIGNFRNRLQVLLGFDVPIGHMLNGLPQLWKRAERWSSETSRANVRRLILPDPENEVIIGHSKRLAFPGFNDQKKLVQLLTEADLDATSPENEVLEAVGRNRNRFSAQFREEFDKFVRLLKRGDRLGAVRSPFWGAIVEISWEAPAAKKKRLSSEFELELDPTDPYTAAMTLIARGEAALQRPWKYEKLPFPIDHMKFQVVREDSSNEPLLQQLTSPSGERLLSGCPIAGWLSRGWFGFCPDESERWVASSDLSQSDRLWLLVHDRRWVRLESALKNLARPPAYALPGILGDRWVLVGQLRNNPGLRRILQEIFQDHESFSERLSSPQTRFLDALRLPEGMLLLPPCMPSVITEGASKIVWSVKTAAAERVWHPLHPKSDSGSFRFDTNDVLALPHTAELEFRAYDANDEEIDRKFINIITGCVSNDFRQPSDPAAFLQNGDFGQLIPVDQNPVAAVSRLGDNNSLYPIIRADRATIPIKRITVDDVPAKWIRCFEILTANFVRKICLPAREFFDIISKIWELSPSKTWSRISDLVENGFVRDLYHRRWHGSVFVARPPGVVIVNDSVQSICRISGLMPESALRKLDRAVEASNGTCRIISSEDLEHLGVIEVRLKKTDEASAIFNSCGILPRNVPSDYKLCSWRDLLATEEDLPPRTTPQRWSRKHGYFRPAEEAPDAAILLERWSFESAQPLYRLRFRERSWSTRSRMWALLAYTAVSGEQIGSLSTDGSVHLSNLLSLPQGFAQQVLHRGAGVCVRDANGCRIYPPANKSSIEAALQAWMQSHLHLKESVALSRHRKALSIRRRADRLAGLSAKW
jgi:hypothetical protein